VTVQRFVMDRGADAWLQKPFTPARLLDAVRPFR